jgi:hypothetical protein
MSLVSKVKDWFVGAPEPDSAKPRAEEHLSRHDRRQAGRARHHETGQAAWGASDKVGGSGGETGRNPDSAPEILGGG